MIDGGILAGYLAIAAARVGGRVLDKAIDKTANVLLDRLQERVSEQLGRKAIDDIVSHPTDASIQRRVGRDIEKAARLDPKLARELSELQSELDDRVGRLFINEVRATQNVQAFGGGRAILGNDNQYIETIKQRFSVRDPTDFSRAPFWAKVLLALGSLAAVAGFALIFMNTGGSRRPGEPYTFDGVGLVLFFAGAVLMLLGNMGKVMSRPRGNFRRRGPLYR